MKPLDMEHSLILDHLRSFDHLN